MVKRLAVITSMVATIASTSAQATPNTMSEFVLDCETTCPIAEQDMAGPIGFGFVNHNQNENGDLRVVVALKNATPNTTYTIYLVCGPTHHTACAHTSIGTLTTNVHGNADSGAMPVPVATLQAFPYGPGARTDHVDVMRGLGDLTAGLYAAAGINYVVPSA